jgi:dUTP pyrophosphatase
MSTETMTPALTVELTLNDASRAAGIDAPFYAQPGDAGADLRTTERFYLAPGERHIAKTGISIALPEGFAAFIHPRSGLAAKHGITVVNSPGTIDAGYRGEIMAILLNTDKDQGMQFEVGDRIAQMVIQRVETARFSLVETLPASVRGEGGLGSTGGFTAPQ